MNSSLAFGVAFQGNKTPAEYRALAEAVDRYSFDVVSVYNDLLFQPALGPLLWMAPYVKHALLGPAALNPFTVHPLEIAGQVALLSMASEGRAYLGLARGAWLDGIGIKQRAPVRTLREAVVLVRHLLHQRREAFTGEVFRHPADASLQFDVPQTNVPITIGTWGTQTARMAGEVADEVKVGGSANPAMVPIIRSAIADGARRASRDAESIGVCLGAVTVVDTDREAARSLARREVAMYLPVVARLDPTVKAPDPHDDISDETLDLFAFAGTPADLIRQVERIAAAGATRIEFGTPLGAHPVEAIRLLGERVLPAFR